MKTIASVSLLAIFIGTGAANHAFGQAAPNNKEFDDYTQIQRDAAKAAARKAHYSSFRVCADPGDMPFSNIKEEGFENKIADVIAKEFGTKATYFWRPYIERGLTAQTFDTNDCDILMNVPSNYESALTTTPIYGSTYVFASRSVDNYNFSGLSDPLLHKLQIGVYELSSLRQSLGNHGIVANVHVHEVSHDGDLDETHQPWWQVKDVVDGKLDIAGVWGPFAGWLKARGAPLKLQPTNLMDDIIPMEFEMAIGVRKTDAVRKYAIENALNKHRDEIKKILDEYGVPLIECSDCLISGSIKAHGIYSAPTVSAEELAKLHREKPEVSREQLETWLKEGADVDAELDNAVLASDNERIGFLLEKGADINKKDLQGYTPLTASVRLGSLDTTKFLLDHGARIDIPDSDGWLPLLHAVLRNDVRAIELLLDKGASADSTAPGGFIALAVAIEEKKFDAAKTLINSGAKIDQPVSKKKLTPLMVVASEPPPESRIRKLQQTLNSMDIAHELLSHGANVNAVSSEGVTPLMIAAAYDNAPMIGLLLQSGAQPGMKSADGQTARDIAAKAENGSAIRALDLFAETTSK